MVYIKRYGNSAFGHALADKFFRYAFVGCHLLHCFGNNAFAGKLHLCCQKITSFTVNISIIQ